MQDLRQAWPHWHAVHFKKLGPTQDVSVMTIDIVGQPLQPRVRTLSPLERHQLDSALDLWIRQGYVEKSAAWVTCNPLFVEKKDGRIRTCIDYRPINAVTTTWEWALPRIKDIRHAVAGNHWYSRFDLKEAFHRIEVRPESRPLTAFHTHRGVYQFTRMPFGLCTAPATYQRFIDWVLHAARANTVNYQDDILVKAPTRSLCRTRTRQVERLLAKHQVEINEAKSERLVQETVFVGLHLANGRVAGSDHQTGVAIGDVIRQLRQGFRSRVRRNGSGALSGQ